MYLLQKGDYPDLLTGSAFFSTGGGGSTKEADSIYQGIIRSNKRVQIKKLSEFKSNATIITSFVIGSLQTNQSKRKPANLAFRTLEKFLGKRIAGVIPVEIGPESLAVAIELASKLRVPLVDADIVGGRCTPEVFLETITLFNFPRTPSAIADAEGNCAILAKASSAAYEEIFFRNFAHRGKDAYIVGYPINVSRLKKAVVQDTVSLSQSIGKKLNEDRLSEALLETRGRIVFEGVVKKIENIEQTGFTRREVYISNKESVAKLFIKNESLILWIDGAVVLTCPDLIVLLNKKNKPIYNLDIKTQSNIKIVGIPAAKLWRSKKGLKLFNPSVFGFPFAPKLLSKG